MAPLAVLLLSFPGLSPSVLAASLIGASLLTLLLYFLRLRRRPVMVPFLPLWESLLLDKKATAWRSRLQRLLSLLISLLVVLALVFAAANPQTETPQEGRSVVVLLDVGASMAETLDGETRLSLAKARIRSWFPSFVGGDQILVVQMGMRPEPLLPFSADMTQVDDALDEASVLDVHADLGRALRYARDVSRGRTRPEIVVVSDGALAVPSDLDPALFPPISFESIAPDGASQQQANLAVTAFSARRYPLSGDRFEVLVEIVHRGSQDRDVELAVYEADERGARGEVVELSRLRLAPDRLTSRSFENLAHAEHGLIAEVRYEDGPKEAFVQDNLARTLLAPRTPVSILVVGQENTFLDAALLVEESFRVTRVSPANYPPSDRFDVTIFDGAFPARDEKTGAAIYLGLPSDDNPNYPLETKGSLEMFGFDTWDEQSTVFRLIDPYDVQVLKGAELALQDGDRVLGRSRGRPIFVSGEREQGRFLALGFSPTESDFVLRAVWPLFVVNLIDEVFPRGRGTVRLGYRTGQVWRPPVEASSGETRATIIGPLHLDAPPRRSVPIADGRAVMFGERAGFFEARTESGVTRFAASLAPLPTGEAATRNELRLFGDKSLPKVEGMQPRPTEKPWYWLLAGVLVVSFVEWWTFHRRWTV